MIERAILVIMLEGSIATCEEIQSTSITIDLEFVMAAMIFIDCSQSEVHMQGLFLPDSLSVSFRHSQSRSRATAPLSKTLPSAKEHETSEMCTICT